MDESIEVLFKEFNVFKVGLTEDNSLFKKWNKILKNSVFSCFTHPCTDKNQRCFTRFTFSTTVYCSTLKNKEFLHKVREGK